MKKHLMLGLVALLVLSLAACGKTIQYSSFDPDAQNYHPKRVAVLPVDPGAYEESRDVADSIVVNVLTERGGLEDVIGGERMKALVTGSETFRKTLTDYTVKYRAVNFSDPELAAKLGELAKADALLLVNVDYWLYTSESKTAKVGLGMRLVDATTGKIVWKARHHVDEGYTFSKPLLKDVAKGVARQILSEMPR